MQQKIEQVEALAERLVKCIPRSSTPVIGVAFNIMCFAIDFAKIIKNIKETSFSETDRIARCIKLSEQSGIGIENIKSLTA